MKYIYMRGFCDLLIKHMADGYSFETFASTLKYPAADVTSWLTDKPEFLAALAIGKMQRKKTLETLLMGKQISLETFIYLTKDDEKEISDVVSNFDENVLIQARERFKK